MNATVLAADDAGWTLPYAFDTGNNPFRDKFGHLSTDEWSELLISSMHAPIIGGIEFPHFASEEIQQRTHGTSGVTALKEAADFYKFIAAKPFFAEKTEPGACFLDFGTGWGRIARFFLRDFDLNCFFGFEPHRTTCYLARSLDPYLCVLNGGYLPDQTLPANRFDLVVGWSVFSHLSEYSTIAWLEELARIMRPDGYCVMSTFGERLLRQLTVCEADLKNGKEVHWYHRNCLKAAGDVTEQQKRLLRGEFVWLGGEGTSEHYGHATILGENTLVNIVKTRKLPFDLIEFDHKTLNMDVFIIRRR
jgi:SAM-dependent methyltransferase